MEAPAPGAPIDPMHSIDDLARLMNMSRRTVERRRAAKVFPAPDGYVGKRPRWWPSTIRAWLSAGAAPHG